MGGRGAWMGFFAFLPLLGSAISILLGLMRANVLISFTSIGTGKVMRYMIIAWPFINNDIITLIHKIMRYIIDVWSSI